jgi:hypothetical protein
MTPTQESIDYWRTRALDAERTIADMESMGIILPHTYRQLLDRVCPHAGPEPLPCTQPSPT